jgi:hypothetical protein
VSGAQPKSSRLPDGLVKSAHVHCRPSSSVTPPAANGVSLKLQPFATSCSHVGDDDRVARRVDAPGVGLDVASGWEVGAVVGASVPTVAVGAGASEPAPHPVRRSAARPTAAREAKLRGSSIVLRGGVQQGEEVVVEQSVRREGRPGGDAVGRRCR